MLSSVGRDKSFITFGPDCIQKRVIESYQERFFRHFYEWDSLFPFNSFLFPWMKSPFQTGSSL